MGMTRKEQNPSTNFMILARQLQIGQNLDRDKVQNKTTFNIKSTVNN